MKRLFSATVAIMILLWSASTLTITAHASTGLVVKRYRTDLDKGEVVEEFIVDEEPVDEPVDEMESIDDGIVDEGSAEPEEPAVAEEDAEVTDDAEDIEVTADTVESLATPTDIDEIEATDVDIHTEELDNPDEIEEVEEYETEV